MAVAEKPRLARIIVGQHTVFNQVASNPPVEFGIVGRIAAIVGGRLRIAQHQAEHGGHPCDGMRNIGLGKDHLQTRHQLPTALENSFDDRLRF